MRLRRWLLYGFLVLAGGLDLYLAATERVAESEQQVRHRLERSDPLLGLEYTAAARERNLRAFGLQGAELSAALARLEALDTPFNRARIESFLDGIAEPERAAEAFCGTGRLPTRYAALPYLVREEGQRRPVELSRIAALEWGDWAARSPLAEVYEDVELSGDRPPDATVMAVAAILLAREQDLLDHRSPWGRGFAGRWSWAALERAAPDIGARVGATLALVHLVAEVARGEGGFCGA